MRLLFVIYLLLCSWGIQAQTEKEQYPGSTPPPPPVAGVKVRNSAVVTFGTLERSGFYPFTAGLPVQLVVFSSYTDSLKKSRSGVAGGKAVHFGVPKQGGTILLEQMDTVIHLSAMDVDSITDILYNECSRWNMTSTAQMVCYYPRHALLFYDDSNNITEYMEMCLECQYILLYNQKTVIELCDEGFALLREHALFRVRKD